jgi:hypothetical protein
VRLIRLCLLVGSSLIVPLSASAAYSNYNNVLLGERAAGLSGAYTALAADPAATPFYNPATSILQEGSHFSGAVSVYNKYETNLGQTGDFAGAPTRLNRGYFRSIPASSGTILNFKEYAVGLSILVPDYDFYNGQIQGSATTVSSLNFIDESLWVGGTFSRRLTPVDSAGISLYYTARNMSRSVNDRITTSATTATLTTEQKDLTSNNIVAILGYHRRLDDHWSVGVSYRPPSVQIAGEGSYYKSTTVTTPYSDTEINQSSVKAETHIPQKLAVGIAREEIGVRTFSLDVQLYEATDYKDFPDFNAGTDDVHYHRTANIAAGYEQYLWPRVSVRGGVFTNLSASESPDANSGYRQLDHINLYGWSANVNLRVHEQTSFTFGGYYSGGSGLSTQLIGNQIQVIPKTQQIFTMLVGTGFHF